VFLFLNGKTFTIEHIIEATRQGQSSMVSFRCSGGGTCVVDLAGVVAYTVSAVDRSVERVLLAAHAAGESSRPAGSA
jgi:hypothetical protein